MSFATRFFGSRARAPDAPLDALRIVVADVETSGLDPHRERLISIGAVAVNAGRIDFGDSFHAVVRQERASAGANILVHGIDGTTQLSGTEAPGVLSAWLGYAGTAPLAGYHADFDRVVLTRALRDGLGVKLANPWLDLTFLVPALFPDHCHREEAEKPAWRSRGARSSGDTMSLDDCLRVFGIEAYARHDALSDALATAQLFQIVAAEAARRGVRTLRALERLEKSERRLAHSLRG